MDFSEVVSYWLCVFGNPVEIVTEAKDARLWLFGKCCMKWIPCFFWVWGSGNCRGNCWINQGQESILDQLVLAELKVYSAFAVCWLFSVSVLEGASLDPSRWPYKWWPCMSISNWAFHVVKLELPRSLMCSCEAGLNWTSWLFVGTVVMFGLEMASCW